MGKCYDNSLSLQAEDSMEVQYLKHLFGDEIEIVKNTTAVRTGFHISEEEDVIVTFKKAKQ